MREGVRRGCGHGSAHLAAGHRPAVQGSRQHLGMNGYAGGGKAAEVWFKLMQSQLGHLLSCVTYSFRPLISRFGKCRLPTGLAWH